MSKLINGDQTSEIIAFWNGQEAHDCDPTPMSASGLILENTVRDIYRMELLRASADSRGGFVGSADNLHVHGIVHVQIIRADVRLQYMQ
jgi:hypothetical protein